MGWIDSLGGLPETVAVLVVFALCLIWVIKAIMKRVVDPLAQSSKETAETLKSAIDTNTKAVKSAVDHNETIITNHLSGQESRDKRQEERDTVFLAEMKGVATAIQESNKRRRAGD